MNNRQNGRRRGRGGQQARNGQPGGPDRGNRIDNRARGNAAQLLEKYRNLARDAQMQGDRVNTEYYLQFADHYFRVLNENRARFEEQRPARGADYRDDFGGDEDGGEGSPQQRYQPREDSADDGWDDGDQQPQQPQQQAPVQADQRRYRDDQQGDRQDRPDRGNNNNTRDRNRRNGNGYANGNGNGNGAANGFAAPDFLSEPIAPRFESDAESEAAPETAAEDAAPKRRRAPRRPRPEAESADA